jgi:hypothetical protein
MKLELVVVTTLLDQEEYPADEIAELYRRRWQAELNLRSLKTIPVEVDFGREFRHSDFVAWSKEYAASVTATTLQPWSDIPPSPFSDDILPVPRDQFVDEFLQPIHRRKESLVNERSL